MCSVLCDSMRVYTLVFTHLGKKIVHFYHPDFTTKLNDDFELRLLLYLGRQRILVMYLYLPLCICISALMLRLSLVLVCTYAGVVGCPCV